MVFRNKGSPDEERIKKGVLKIKKPSSVRTQSKKLAGEGVVLAADWEKKREGIMKEASLAKFKQHTNLRHLLLNTKDAPLIAFMGDGKYSPCFCSVFCLPKEPKDVYWGAGKKDGGENRYGKLLMEIRAELKKLSAEKGEVIPPPDQVQQPDSAAGKKKRKAEDSAEKKKTTKKKKGEKEEADGGTEKKKRGRKSADGKKTLKGKYCRYVVKALTPLPLHTHS